MGRETGTLTFAAEGKLQFRPRVSAKLFGFFSSSSGFGFERSILWLSTNSPGPGGRVGGLSPAVAEATQRSPLISVLEAIPAPLPPGDPPPPLPAPLPSPSAPALPPE